MERDGDAMLVDDLRIEALECKVASREGDVVVDLVGDRAGPQGDRRGQEYLGLEPVSSHIERLRRKSGGCR